MTNKINNNIFYVHSPITYTVAKALISKQTKNQNNFFICARSLRIPGLTYVPDDGVWGIDGTVQLLQAIQSSGFNNNIHLYLPHTAFLFGKSIKLINAFSSYSYLEEGRTATAFAPLSVCDRKIDATAYQQALKSKGLEKYFGISPQFGSKLNHHTNYFFDPIHPKYKSCFAVSDNAFKDYKNRIQLNIVHDQEAAQTIHYPRCMLVILPSFTELLINFTDDFFEIFKVILGIIRLEKNTHPEIKQLVLKLHPQDHLEIRKQPLLTEIHACLNVEGIFFEQFDLQSKVDPFVEPAFLGFEQYLVLGNSSAEDYLRKFLSTHRFKVCSLDRILGFQKEITKLNPST
jgi:hypothetical protein